MVNINKITGRLGNQMFEFAALYQFTKDLGVDYYVQDEKWFVRYKDDIQKMFGIGIPPTIDKVSIHVRRGDYVDNKFYVDLSLPNYHHIHVDLSQRQMSADLGGAYFLPNYYELAMAKFSNEKFLVFSDDINWCKQQYFLQGCEFSEGLDEFGDLNLMAACKHNIIANSSFSWWAAYLNKNPNKIVIAPKAWYTDGVERTTCPKEWVRL